MARTKRTYDLGQYVVIVTNQNTARVKGINGEGNHINREFPAIPSITESLDLKLVTVQLARPTHPEEIADSEKYLRNIGIDLSYKGEFHRITSSALNEGIDL